MIMQFGLQNCIYVIWAQKIKTMDETVDYFERYLLAYFGLPSILHTDNSQKFL